MIRSESLRRVLMELRARVDALPEFKLPGTPRRWVQRELTEDEIAYRDAQARADRLAKEQNLAAGIGALAPAATPVRLDVLDAEQTIKESLVYVEAHVCLWLGLTPTGGSDPLVIIDRLDSLVDRIVEHDDLASWVDTSLRRLSLLAARVIGEAESIKRLEARCPECGSLSLRALPERKLIVCINPGCRCSDEGCPCQEGRRHAWSVEWWAELAEVLSG